MHNHVSFISTYSIHRTSVPSVLWRCWLGGRKGIWPVKNWVMGCWRSEVQTCIWPNWCHCHSLSLASVKSRLVLPFWYWLTRVVLDKGPLNVCVCYSIPLKTRSFQHSNYGLIELLQQVFSKPTVAPYKTLQQDRTICFISLFFQKIIKFYLP